MERECPKDFAELHERLEQLYPGQRFNLKVYSSTDGKRRYVEWGVHLATSGWHSSGSLSGLWSVIRELHGEAEMSLVGCPDELVAADAAETVKECTP